MDAPGPDGPIVPGQILFGRFEVLRQLDVGGMGQVWLVRHIELDSQRALKFILPRFSIHESARARFGREARVMARFAHPNIVVVHDASLAGDTAFIEMEYIRGRSLNRIMTPGKPMPLDWIGRVLDQLCDALQVAHEHHVVHRDLKPSNLMLVDGRPPGKEFLKILDFGVAKLLSPDVQDAGGRLVTDGFLGTVQYASPEQLKNEAVDGRSDLYSSGVILYEMLTGHRPFDGSAMEQMHAHAYLPPPPMGLKNPRADVPPAVERVVMRCLAKDPADRPQSARDLAEEFRGAVPGSDATSSSRRRRWLRLVVPVGLVTALTCLALVHSKLATDPTAGAPAKVVRNPGLGSGDSTLDREEIDVDLRTNRPDNIFAPGDELVITVANHSDRDLFLELIGTGARGERVLLAPSTTVVPAGQSFRCPSEGALSIQPEPGREQITAFVRDTPFPPGEPQGDQDRTARVVKKTIVIETR